MKKLQVLVVGTNAFSEITGVMAGIQEEAIVPVTPESVPVLECFLSYVHKRTAKIRIAPLFLLAIVSVLFLAGCAGYHKPHRIEPLTFRRCLVTTAAPGVIGCDCSKPIVAWDAQLKRKVIYCDGKVQ